MDIFLGQVEKHSIALVGGYLGDLRRNRDSINTAGQKRRQTIGGRSHFQEGDVVPPRHQTQIVQSHVSRQEAVPAGVPMATFPFQTFGVLDRRVHDQKIIQLGLQAQKHRHVSTGSDRVGNMGRANDPNVDFSGKHRLGGTTGNDKNKLRIEAVLSEKSLFPGEPQRHRVPAHGPVNQGKPGWNFGGGRLVVAKDQEANEEGRKTRFFTVDFALLKVADPQLVTLWPSQCQ